MHYIAHPVPLNALEKDWLKIHDKLGHMSFAQMDRMVKQKLLPNKFQKLRGKHFMCPSCAFGKMKKRAWRHKGSTTLKHVIKQS